MNQYQHQARKRFGQNFLHDQRIIYQIIESLMLQPGQHWVEIGPGQGALTKPLIAAGVELDIIELDRDLVRLLQQCYATQPNLSIHSADALKFDFSQLAGKGDKLHVVGNLPYNISTPLLFHLLDYAPHIASMTFMLQKELVDRMCAAPGSKTYGRLSIMLQYHCKPDFLFEVPPESFDPIPQVTSAVIRLSPHAQPPVLVDDLALMNKIVTQAFSQRRKTVRNALKKMLPANTLTDLAVDGDRRPETLSLAEYASISNAITQALASSDSAELL